MLVAWSALPVTFCLAMALNAIAGNHTQFMYVAVCAGNNDPQDDVLPPVGQTEAFAQACT